MKKVIKFLITTISKFIYWAYLIKVKLTHEELKAKKKNKLKLKLDDQLAEETYKFFKEHFENSVFFNSTTKIREYAIKTAVLNDKRKECTYLEFGVWKGESSNFFSKYVNKLYCFDSFEGLSEDWAGWSGVKGQFNLGKKIPTLNSNIEVTVGLVDDTLDNFLKKHNPKINFVHMDFDTYTPTKFTLEKIKPYLIKDSIIIFDELYNYLGWKNGEFKALYEVFKEDEFIYKAFNLNNEQCVIQIT